MAKRRESWERVYERIHVVPRPGLVRTPPVTDADLDEAESQLGLRLPPSYRAFMKRFGPGRFAGVGYTLWPVTRQTNRRLGSVVEGALKRREAIATDPEGFANPAWELGLVYFASYFPHEIVWDTAAVVDKRALEYRVYNVCWEEEQEPLAIAGSFWQFVEWAQASSGPYFTPAELRAKKSPRKRDVKGWLEWNNGTVRELARAIREEGRTESLPVLADALEEAGCTNADLIESCRSGQPEVDGRWAVEVLLGKE
jgi:hypothetical protein